MAGARDGQLRTRRGADSPPWALQMFDDDLGLWLTLCQADEEEEMVRAGIPILRGPYVVNYTDVPTDGSTKTLWTPAVGDVLLRLFADWQTVVQWDNGAIYIGQNVDGDAAPPVNVITYGTHGCIGTSAGAGQLDTIIDSSINGLPWDGAGANRVSTAYVFQTTDPVQVRFGNHGGSDPIAGHVEIYALVARAVAP